MPETPGCPTVPTLRADSSDPAVEVPRNRRRRRFGTTPCPSPAQVGRSAHYRGGLAVREIPTASSADLPGVLRPADHGLLADTTGTIGADNRRNHSPGGILESGKGGSSVTPLFCRGSVHEVWSGGNRSLGGPGAWARTGPSRRGGTRRHLGSSTSGSETAGGRTRRHGVRGLLGHARRCRRGRFRRSTRHPGRNGR